jgi:hypothetical protein
LPCNHILTVDRMAENPDLNPEPPPRRRGRRSKAEELRLTLATVGCDPAAIDPLRILAGIAADETIAPTARVAAAKALLDHPAETKQPVKDKAEPRPSKKAAAARAAAAAGGPASQWGSDLWPDGRRPQ